MLSGPTNDYFGIRGGFPTPNESSLRSGLTPGGFPSPNEPSARTGLTPGGSGSMFPVPSPNPALFGTAATPGTIDFHRTAVSAAAAKRDQAQHSLPPAAPTSQPQALSNGAGAAQPHIKADQKSAPGPFDPHDNDAANGLFMLAQGRNTTQPPAVQSYPVGVAAPVQVAARPATSTAPAVQPINTSPQMNGAPSLTGSSVRGASEASAGSDESEEARPNTRARGKRNSGGGAARRKAEEPLAKAPASKKSKTNGGSISMSSIDMEMMDHSDDDGLDDKDDGTGPRSKMTDEEKRKNFLERNRYVLCFFVSTRHNKETTR